ncbi:uncharacterized protein HKW66_Vig0112550 [Vigna angularis]|uniref:Uncharacterized protein n=1 Tax=Phaseolus angularis TaxID=3914 RepID=A0A8T0L1P4_PHAAN|nr:uncharacterized protein HKW66_Vig0112550 [Vigna angularis]
MHKLTIQKKQSSICDEISKNKVQEIKPVSNFSHDIGPIDTSEGWCPIRDERATEGLNVCDWSFIFGDFSRPVLVTWPSDHGHTVPDPNGFIIGKDQKIDISEILDGARCSGCLNQDEGITEENKLSSLAMFLIVKTIS